MQATPTYFVSRLTVQSVGSALLRSIPGAPRTAGACGLQPLVDGRDEDSCLIADREFVVSRRHGMVPLEAVEPHSTACRAL